MHKVSIITRPEDARELHHQQVVIETLRGTIASLQAINPEQYKQQIEDLNNQLVDALLEQVEVLRLRSNAFREARLRIDNTSLTAKVIVADASAAVGLSSSPNIPVVNSMLSHSREQIIRTTPVPTNTTLVMGSISSSDAIADVPRPALRKTTQQSMQQSNSSSTTVSWVDAEHFNQKMHFAYGYPNDPSRTRNLPCISSTPCMAFVILLPIVTIDGKWKCGSSALQNIWRYRTSWFMMNVTELRKYQAQYSKGLIKPLM